MEAFLIIDALDEREAESMQVFLKAINGLTELCNKSSGRDRNEENIDAKSLASYSPFKFEQYPEQQVLPRLKFFVTSRWSEKMRECFETQYYIALLPSLTNPDITLLVKSELLRLKRKLRLRTKEMRGLLQVLVDRPEGMFLWIIFAI